MDISDTTSSPGESQHSRGSLVLNSINVILKDFDVLPSQRKITRLIFSYGWLLLLASYLLYFMTAAIFHTRLCQTYGPKLPNCAVKGSSMSLFFQTFIDMILGRNKLPTGSVEIVFLVTGAILLLSFFKIWRGYVPKTLRDLINNNRITAIRESHDRDSWIFDKTKVADRYLEFLSKYHNALSKAVNYTFCVILLLYAIFYIVFLGFIACSTPVKFEKLHVFIPSNNPDVFGLNFFPLVFFTIIELILFYSFGITWSVIHISGRYLRELLWDFHIQSDLTHLDRCGGLKILGNFCLRLAVPLVAISLFFFLYDFNVQFSIGGYIGMLYIFNFFATLLLCGLAFYLFVWASVIPLLKIHAKMIDADEISQQKQSIEINRLEKRLQDLIDKDQLEQAKVVKEKLELAQTLNTSYPKWPFITLKAATFSALLLSFVGSLLNLIFRLLPDLLKK